MNAIFQSYLEPFAGYEPLPQRIGHVFAALPDEVARDFLDDPRFQITIDNFEPGKGWTLLMDLPCPTGAGSRCVVLKRKLAEADEDFALYVIAHELAHAYLRNGGWGEITDREEAADALAASWGFVRPNRQWRQNFRLPEFN
tara:strand:+ start:8554 stop:8979 length:426 start_codon:yes stop_codon:yes gene_type:complete